MIYSILNFCKGMELGTEVPMIAIDTDMIAIDTDTIFLDGQEKENQE